MSATTDGLFDARLLFLDSLPHPTLVFRDIVPALPEHLIGAHEDALTGPYSEDSSSLLPLQNSNETTFIMDRPCGNPGVPCKVRESVRILWQAHILGYVEEEMIGPPTSGCS